MPKSDVIQGDEHHRIRQKLEKEMAEAGIPADKARTKINLILDARKDEFEKGKR